MKNAALHELQKIAAEALNRGNYPVLVQACIKILNLEPTHADAWFFLAIVESTKNNMSKAIELVNKAIALQQDNPEFFAMKARFHSQVNQRTDATAAANKALNLDPKQAIVLDTLGVVYTRLGHYQKAKQVLELSVEKHPDNPQFLFNYASLLQFLGDEDQATHYFEKAIYLQPKFYRAHWALSELEKNAPSAKRLSNLQLLFNDPLISDEGKLYLGHAISREYEKNGDYQQAFKALQRGKATKLATINYSIGSDQKVFSALKRAFVTPHTNKMLPPEKTAKPIFVLGMPRTGTTLVERILSSHSEIISLGELQEFSRAVKIASKTSTLPILDEDVINATTPVNQQAIGQHYLDSIADKLFSENYTPSQFFIDKMPLNFLYIGFILQAIPHAKIVCLRRNPLDTCLSNYRQLFAINFSPYNYHYKLSDTAHYYTLFADLINHWTHLYGDRIHQVCYEELTAEPEKVTKKLFQYIGAEWQPQVLNFQDNTSPVTTASTTQVRQPLYRSAVQRWKKYDRQLAPIKHIFQQHNIPLEQ